MAVQSRIGQAHIRDAGEAFAAASLVPTAIVDGNGAIVAANAPLLAATGLSLGDSLPALVSAPERPLFQRHLMAALAGSRIETDIPLLSPGRRSTSLRIVLGPFASPIPRLVVQILEHDAERDSRDDLSRLRVAVDGAGQGIWDHDLRRGTAYFSPNWYRMRGFEPGEDVDGELGSWFSRLHPEDRPRIEEAARRQNMGELAHNAFEYRERHRAGHYIWILSRGRPIAWNTDGTVARILGTDTDITALKTAELQLAAEKERLRITLQSIADGMVATDMVGRITSINPAAERFTGVAAGDALGQAVGRVLSARAGKVALDVDDVRAAAGEAPVQLDGDTQLINCDGTATDITLTVSLITGPDGPQGFVFVFQDVTHSRALRRRLAHGATHDQLTDLPNRLYFEDVLRSAGEEARTTGTCHALCYIDLDRFKSVNDGAGHAAGDAVLKRVAVLLRNSCRSSDFAARVGGDEFVLILRDCPIDHAERVANKLIAALSAENFTFDRRRYPVGASIGIAAISGDDSDLMELIRRADIACYRSKDLGRGRVSISTAA